MRSKNNVMMLESPSVHRLGGVMSLLDEKVAGDLSAGLHGASAAAMEHLEARVGRQTSKLRASAKTRKSAVTRERIMVAASELMTERGGTDFQMSEVSARCNMSKGALYYYFADKGALIEAIFDRSVDALVSSIEDVVAGAASSMESIQGLALVFARGIREGGPLSFAMSRELLNVNRDDVLPTFETHLARVILIIVAQIDRAKQEGVVRAEVNSRLGAIATCGAFIFAALESAYETPDAMSNEELADQLVDIAMNGLGTEVAGDQVHMRVAR